MQYKVKRGAVDRSYGIYVAKMLKFPEEIIKDAEQKARELERFEDFNAENQDEEDEPKREGTMDMEENDLISFAKRATLQMKHKVLAMVQSTVEKAKNIKSTEEKKNLLRKLIQDIKNMEYEG
jgi:DNA mismatch repair protein MSH2